MAKKLMWAAAVAATALSVSACRNEAAPARGESNDVLLDNGAAASAEVSEADRTFVADAAASDMFEIESSKLAQQKATLPAIKTYAEMMITEHGRSSADLKTAAGNIPVPATLPADKQAKLDALRGLSGQAFERQYLADQRAGHQETLSKLNTYIASAAAGPLKSHAETVKPVVEKHLRAVENIK